MRYQIWGPFEDGLDGNFDAAISQHVLHVAKAQRKAKGRATAWLMIERESGDACKQDRGDRLGVQSWPVIRRQPSFGINAGSKRAAEEVATILGAKVSPGEESAGIPLPQPDRLVKHTRSLGNRPTGA
jgi:hypothetical protein